MAQGKNSLPFLIYAVILTGILSVIASCASIGTPSGGPRDYDPPVYKKSTPASNQTNVKSGKIEIEFDEIIQLDNPSEKVVISPPQKEMPKIKASGKKIYIEMLDSLLPNTTYAIDFSDAIKDNNEGNVLNGFSLAFSTGPTIDSMQISGTVLNAENLEPVTGMLIGVHTNLDDSAFTKIPFRRISRSDAYGRFTIRNLAKGDYRIFGLKDADRNYMFNNPTEEIAFYPQIITPSVTETVTSDTITVGGKDSVITKTERRYLPDSLILLSFNEGYKPQYLSKTERTYRNRFSIIFAAPSEELPKLTPLNFTPATEEWNLLERSVKNDTLVYWIKDSSIYNIDTLSFAAEYKITDSLLNIIPHNDTLTFIFRELKGKAKKKNKKDTDSIETEFMVVNAKINSPMDVYSSPAFAFDQPIAELNPEAVKLQVKRDSIWIEEKNYSFIPDTLSPRTYILKNDWDLAKEYRFTVDSLGITGIYGNQTAGIDERIRVRKGEEYSNLYLETVGVKSGAFVELLDKSDKPIRFATVRNGGAEFVYIRPGTYYARLTIDKDATRKFTPGKYSEQKQPESVYYYPNPIELKPNWDVEQTWDVFSTPLNQQKPRVITKNKPVDRKKDEEENRRDKENDPIYSNRPTTNLKY